MSAAIAYRLPRARYRRATLADGRSRELSVLFWAIRHSTPLGSMSTKSRMPQGLSSGGSAFTPYLATNP
jgi:hypothetical protein